MENLHRTNARHVQRTRLTDSILMNVDLNRACK